MSGKKNSSGFGLRGCLSCFGCGCAFPLIFIIVLAIAAIFFLPQFSEPSSRPASLPKPVDVTREDRWSLQDKLAAARSQPGMISLRLTQPEFNALLSRVELKPAAGFALTKVWSFPSRDGLSFVLEGSGFWMRRLFVVLQFTTPPEGRRMTNMVFNDHPIPEKLIRTVGIAWLERWLKDSAGIDVHIEGPSEYTVTVASDDVILTGPFPWLRTSLQGEGQ
ncbi:MAG TPA: hypothetical protein PKM25_18385 [Candidatus Ozemobacteraceae bacterium]|nr:hypothetical protein [Candidatus Ozemobacteraceae bacterium]